MCCGSADLKTMMPIQVQSGGTWQPFQIDAKVPNKAVALGVYLRLLPPQEGTIAADFDNIRIIEWAGPQAQFSPLYDYALPTRTGELTFVQQILLGTEQWFTDSSKDQNK